MQSQFDKIFDFFTVLVSMTVMSLIICKFDSVLYIYENYGM